MLGQREPEIYGSETLDDIQELCQKKADELKIEIDFKQSNHEGELITWIQEALNNVGAVIINAGAYTHTSIAIHDALKLLSCPIVEVHISDIKEREEFRHHSYIEPLATKIIVGEGPAGYTQAIEFIAKNIN